MSSFKSGFTNCNSGVRFFVKKRHGCAILDRLLEIVNRNVIAENILRPFLARDERRAGEGEKQRLRQGRPHVQSQCVVLAAMRLVRQDDHVGPVAKQFRRLELMNRARENVAVVSA